MENNTIIITEEQAVDIAARAGALGITPEQYKDMLVQAWLDSGEEMSIDHTQGTCSGCPGV